MRKLIAALVMAATMAMVPGAQAFTWPPPASPVPVPNGDFQAYSLPLLNLFVFGEARYKGPGSYSVDSSPGTIKDFVVVGSFPSAARNNTDVRGAKNGDDACETINAGSGANYGTSCQDKNGIGCASYVGADWGFVGAKDPGGVGEFTGDVAGTWEVKISALNAYPAGLRFRSEAAAGASHQSGV